MTKKIESLVAEVLDPYRVALNVGADQGVTESSDVTIWRIVEVRDPLTGEDLGGVRLDNLKMRVTMVAPRYSVASVAHSNVFSTNWSFLGPRKRIATSTSKTNEDTVTINVGDEATVYVPEPDPSE